MTIFEVDVLDRERELYSAWDTCAECGWPDPVTDLAWYAGDWLCYWCHRQQTAV